MWSYKITNDFRPSTQCSSIYEIAATYLDAEERLGTYNDSFSSNVQPYIGIHFGLKNGQCCAKESYKKNMDFVYLNFIKKFQFPNPSQQDYQQTISDGIRLAPLREIVKILYYLKQRDEKQSFLTFEEISNFIFYNACIAKVDTIDYELVVTDILKYRASGIYPDYIALEEQKDEAWKESGRSLNDIIKTLSNSNFILYLDFRKRIEFQNYLTYEKHIKNIVNYNTFFEINISDSKTNIEEQYLNYFNQNFETFKNNEDKKIQNDYSPEWFKEKAKQYAEYELEVAMSRKEFCDEFSIEKIKTLSGTDLLNKVFLNGSKDALCYKLEYDKDNIEKFGSIKGGSAYKYDLFYSNGWTSGTHSNPIKLSLEDAIDLGSKIKNAIINGAEILENNKNTDSLETYKKISEQFANISYISKAWVLKYYQMLFPELLPTFYSDYWIDKIIELLKLETSNNKIVKLGSIALYVKECGIQNAVFARIICDHINNISMGKIDSITEIETKFERNRILFGAPGTGKSYRLNKERTELLQQENDFERVTFYPAYSYANFVGTYKPVSIVDENGKELISYKYTPGPFMRIYVNAMKSIRNGNPKPYLLIIEEINRADIVSVFGDIFQLLDRNEYGASEYEIQATEDIKKYLAEELGGEPDEYASIKIPNNMFIWATMNSADQGVFPMDTAVKRRWEFTYIGIDDGEEDLENIIIKLANNEQSFNWNTLRKAINNKLSNLKINEDKLLGPYFISPKIFKVENYNDKFIESFKNKVLMYLFDDAAKQKRSSLFSEKIDITKYSSICNEFDKIGINIFCNEIASIQCVNPIGDD